MNPAPFFRLLRQAGREGRLKRLRAVKRVTVAAYLVMAARREPWLILSANAF